MSMDFPRAWQLCRATPAEQHHERCSYRTDGLLCDCEVVMQHPEKLDDVIHTLDGEIYTPPPEPHGPRLPYPGEFCQGGDSRHQLVAKDIRAVQFRVPGRARRWSPESATYCDQCRGTFNPGSWRYAL